jgi:chorismate-pyruvate lyase
VQDNEIKDRADKMAERILDSKKDFLSKENLIMQDKTLSLFQKILLTTDGTVTNLLRLYTGKTIKVKKIMQDFAISGDSESMICPNGTPILRRNIILCCEIKNYIYAESIFVYEHLSRQTQYKLLETDQPIGLMWKEEKLDTYREIIKYNAEHDKAIEVYFNINPDTIILSRTYLIYNKQNIIGMITEKFPITYFREDYR